MKNETVVLKTVLEALRSRQVEPVLVGGLALVLLNSRRVTQDVDLVVANSADIRARVTEAFYDAGFELGTWIDENGRIAETVSEKELAVLRARNDHQTSELFFVDPVSRQEIDLLLDFPVPASELLARSRTVIVDDLSIRVADPTDLLKMKKQALAERNESRDAQDVEFLEKLLGLPNS